MEQRPRAVLDAPGGKARVFDQNATYLKNNPLFDYDNANVRKLIQNYAEGIDQGLQPGATKEARNASISALNYVRKHGNVTGWTPKRTPRTAEQIAATEMMKLQRRGRSIAQRRAWGNTEAEVMDKVRALEAAVPLKEGAENMQYSTYGSKEGPRVHDSMFYVSNGVLRGGKHVGFKMTEREVLLPIKIRSRRMLNSLATYEDPKLAIPKRKVLFRVGRWIKGRAREEEVAQPQAEVEMAEN